MFQCKDKECRTPNTRESVHGWLTLWLLILSLVLTISSVSQPPTIFSVEDGRECLVLQPQSSMFNLRSVYGILKQLQPVCPLQPHTSLPRYHSTSSCPSSTCFHVQAPQNAQCGCTGGVQIGSCNQNYQCPGQSVCQVGQNNGNQVRGR